MKSYRIMLKAPTKTSRYSDEEGRLRWRVKSPEPILLCTCGNKYIKTRHGQKVCMECLQGEIIYARSN